MDDRIFAHAFLQGCQLLLEDLHRLRDDVVNLESSSRLDSEDELVVVFTNFYCLLNSEILGVLHALLAERARVNFLDVDHLSLLIEAKNFSRALVNDSSSLFLTHFLLHLFLVDLDDWLLSHDTSGNR